MAHFMQQADSMANEAWGVAAGVVWSNMKLFSESQLAR